nr:MAG TPA: hypothetical protein [Caudoviricetes sp.]
MGILDKHVGLISIHTEQVRTGKLKILICKIVLVQTLKSCNNTHPVLFLSDKCKTVCYNRAKRSSVLIYSISTIICVLIICFVRIIWICRY